MDTPDLIVTRHAGAVEWLCRELTRREAERSHETRLPAGGLLPPVWREHPNWPGEIVLLTRQINATYRLTGIPVRASATADDVRGKHVVGNLPLHLAALCRLVTAIEFTSLRGGPEYTAADMDEAGARLANYEVRPA